MFSAGILQLSASTTLLVYNTVRRTGGRRCSDSGIRRFRVFDSVMCQNGFNDSKLLIILTGKCARRTGGGVRPPVEEKAKIERRHTFAIILSPSLSSLMNRQLHTRHWRILKRAAASVLISMAVAATPSSFKYSQWGVSHMCATNPCGIWQINEKEDRQHTHTLIWTKERE